MAELFTNVVFWIGVVLGAWVIIGLRAASGARQGYRNAKAGLPGLRTKARSLTVRAIGRTAVLVLAAAVLGLVCYLGNFRDTTG